MAGLQGASFRVTSRLVIASLVVATFGVAWSTKANAISLTAGTNTPVIGLAATPTGGGYWQVGLDGGIINAGDAGFFGSMSGTPLNRPIVGMAATTSGRGYWLTASDGGMFSFGDAKFYGSTGGMRLNQPIVGMAPTATGAGYWLVASDGGVFSFGDARFYGSTGGIKLNAPIVGMAPTPSGRGYWMVASDGGIFGFGDAGFYGSTGGIKLNKPISGMAPAPDGHGYLMVASDGGVFKFGSVDFFGSAATACQTAPATAIATSRGARGYWITFGDARAYAFSPSSTAPVCGPTGGSRADAAARDYLDRLNSERQARGLSALAWDPGLAQYATDWSQHMSTGGFGHSNLSNLLNGGRFGLVGENIASGRGNGVTAGTLHVAWMHSDGHRANMLSPAFNLVGIGVFCAPDGTMYATTSFGRTMSAGAAPPGGGTPPVEPVVRSDPGSASC